MRVWSVIGQKGGVGKTTLAIHLAIAAMLKGEATCIVDLDAQQSAERWAELRARRHKLYDPAIVHGDPAKLQDMLAAAKDTDTDLAIIDTPPVINKTTILAAGAARVVLVPTRASILDDHSLKDTLEVLVAAQAGKKTVVVLNGTDADSPADARAIRATAAAFGIAVIKTSIENDAAYRSSLREGRGVGEVAPRSPAARQIDALYRLLRKR